MYVVFTTANIDLHGWQMQCAKVASYIKYIFFLANIPLFWCETYIHWHTSWPTETSKMQGRIQFHIPKSLLKARSASCFFNIILYEKPLYVFIIQLKSSSLKCHISMWISVSFFTSVNLIHGHLSSRSVFSARFLFFSDASIWPSPVPLDHTFFQLSSPS